MISNITPSQVFKTPLFLAAAVAPVVPTLLTFGTCKILEGKGLIKPSTTYILTAAATLVTYIATSIALTTLGIISIKTSLLLGIPILLITGTFLMVAFCKKSKAKNPQPDLEGRIGAIIQKLKTHTHTLNDLGKKLELAEQMLRDKKNLNNVVSLVEEISKEIEGLTLNTLKDPEPFITRNMLTYFYDVIVNEVGDHQEILTRIDYAIKRLDSEQIGPSIEFNIEIHAYIKKHDMNITPPEQRKDNFSVRYKRYPCKP